MDRQCSSCGGFCKKSGCERENVQPTPQREMNQAMRLYKAVERLSLQAGEETDEAVDWLCGEHGGMFKLYEAYFSPRTWVGLTPDERRVIIEQWHRDEGETDYLCRLTEAKLKEKNA